MTERNDLWVRIAESALDRGDHLAAFCYARRAAAAPELAPPDRCDACMILTRLNLALDLPEPALAFAVQSHLTACRVHDAEREGRAAQLVTQVAARYPHLVCEG
ncbi:MAG: hypothetical protein ACM3XM_05975 [Mycobacterium leprae]